MTLVLNKALLLLFVVLAILSTGVSRSWAEDPAPEKTPPAPEAKPKPPEFYFQFLQYRYALHGRVIKRWEDLVKANRDKLIKKRFTLHYYINADGYISVIESAPGTQHPAQKPNEQKLAEYALALENKDPTALPDLVQDEYPHGYFYQITFTVQ